jgi:hypothetical protein
MRICCLMTNPKPDHEFSAVEGKFHVEVDEIIFFTRVGSNKSKINKIFFFIELLLFFTIMSQLWWVLRYWNIFKGEHLFLTKYLFQRCPHPYSYFYNFCINVLNNVWLIKIKLIDKSCCLHVAQTCQGGRWRTGTLTRL